MALDEATIVRELWRQRIGLVAFIEVIVHDEHLAEDVFQEISVAALQKRSQINDAAHLKHWLLQAARFYGVAALRKTSRQRVIFNDQLLDRIEAAWTQHDAGVISDQSAALKTCLERLSPYARRIIELRYGQGITGQDLARALGRKVDTIYKALTRTHQTLADCIRAALAAESNDTGTR
ncbi:sigma-70 family RNA polymerase sigma factor [Planctomycetales bacterium ZRK34]|nr:sigma-70 family RNA polymerase sigma factor [Planctomycetales bacterium ZRK34]